MLQKAHLGRFKCAERFVINVEKKSFKWKEHLQEVSVICSRWREMKDEVTFLLIQYSYNTQMSLGRAIETAVCRMKCFNQLLAVFLATISLWMLLPWLVLCPHALTSALPVLCSVCWSPTPGHPGPAKEIAEFSIRANSAPLLMFIVFPLSDIRLVLKFPILHGWKRDCIDYFSSYWNFATKAFE